MATIFILIELMYGFFHFHRTIESIRTKNYVDSVIMTKIVSSYLVWIFISAFMFQRELVLFSLQVWWPVFAVQLTPQIAAKINCKRFKQEIPVLINGVIMKMRMGQSFRDAMSGASQGLSDFTRVKIEKLLESLTLFAGSPCGDENDQQVRQILSFFKNIEREPHLLLARLIHYRQKLKVEEEFLLKRARALQQLRSQVIVLSFLYVGLLAYVIYRFGYLEHRKTLFLSTILFLAGIIVTLYQGRSFKWKV